MLQIFFCRLKPGGLGGCGEFKGDEKSIALLVFWLSMRRCGASVKAQSTFK
jgi:hypothetical protein